MNLFDKAKKTGSKQSKNCAHCGKEFTPDPRNQKRGWARCCSKSCAVSLRNSLFRMTQEERVAEMRDIKLSDLGI